MDDLITCDLDEGDSFGIARLETDRSPSCNVKSVAMSANTVEFELWVDFDEVVMRADLRINESAHISRPC